MQRSRRRKGGERLYTAMLQRLPPAQKAQQTREPATAAAPVTPPPVYTTQRSSRSKDITYQPAYEAPNSRHHQRRSPAAEQAQSLRRVVMPGGAARQSACRMP